MSNEEKQLLRVCMNSAEVAALALAAQGGASMLLSLSYYVMGEPGEAVSDAISAVQKLLTVRGCTSVCICNQHTARRLRFWLQRAIPLTNQFTPAAVTWAT